MLIDIKVNIRSYDHLTISVTYFDASSLSSTLQNKLFIHFLKKVQI